VTKKILVAYASRYNSTKEIAERIAAVLNSEGFETDCAEVQTVTSTKGYDAFVVGSPLYMGKWLVEAMDFLRLHASSLQKVPAAAFSVGGTLKDETEVTKAMAEKSFQALHLYFAPTTTKTFAGKISLDKALWKDRQILKMVKAEEGDFRNWDEIETWALEIPSLLGICH